MRRHQLAKRLAATLLLAGLILPAVAWAQGLGNPALNLFNAINRGFREGADDINDAQQKRDQFDIRPSQRLEDNRVLVRANTLLAEQRWNDGLEALQFLLDQPADAFSFRPGHLFVSLQSDVDRIFAGLPVEAVRLYETRYANVADKLLSEALASQNETQLVELSNRFLHTAAGKTGQGILIQQWMARGDYAGAARALTRLVGAVDESARPDLLTRLATCQALMGDAAAAKETAAPLEEAVRERIALLTVPAVTQPQPGITPLLPYGDTVRGGPSPVLAPGARWSAELIERYAVVSRIHDLQAQLRDEKRALLPLNQPLAIGELLAFRTLRGLQVRSLRTGELLWERRVSSSPEEKSLAVRNLAAKNFFGARFNLRGVILDREEFYEQDQLTSLMYRDSVFASLSSDGVRLFGVEDHGEASFDAPMSVWRERRELQNAEWSTNVLTAYEAATGRVLWRVGGPAVEAEFSARLAGTFFFGPPVADDGELLAIGERQGEVQLIALSPQTGDELWSLPLAVPGGPLSQDVVRRQWACQPTVAAGLVLCPTTTGWFAAVDRHSHRLAWCSRYAPRLDMPRQRGMGSVHNLQSLNDRWETTRPLVHAGYVLVAPPELPDEGGFLQPQLFCFRLSDGQKVWERSRSDGLCLVGLHGQNLIIVGNNSVEAIEVGTKPISKWKSSLKDRQPCGRGLLVNDELWLPVEGEQLLKIDLKQGREQAMLPMQGVDGDLGNLTLAQGELVSLSYQRLSVYRTDLATQSPGTDAGEVARALLGEVRQQLLSRKFAEADSLLATFVPPASIAPLAAEQRQLQWEVLVGLSSGADNPEQPLARLKALANDESEHRTAARLQAEALAKAGNWEAAAPAFLQLLVNWPATEYVHEGTRTVRIDGWLYGRLTRLREVLQVGDRTKLDNLVSSWISSNPLPEDRRHMAGRALAAFPVGVDLELAAADAALSRGEKARALLHLQRARANPHAEPRARALVRLAEVLEAFEWRDDAISTWEEMKSAAPVMLPGGENSQQLAVRRLYRLRAEEVPPAVVAFGPVENWRMEQSGSSLGPSAMHPVPLHQRSFRALDNLRMQSLEREERLSERLAVEDRRTGQQLASLPLRGQPQLAYAESTAAWRMGPLALVVHQGVINAVGWPDANLLWTFAPDLRGWEMQTSERSMASSSRGLVPSTIFMSRMSRPDSASPASLLSANTPWGILIGTKGWTAIDPLNGEILWTEPLRQARTTAGAVGENLFHVSMLSLLEVRSLHDGATQAIDSFKPLLRGVLGVPGGDLLTLAATLPPATPPTSTVSRKSILGETRWSVIIPRAAPMDLIEDQAVCWLASDNIIHIVLLDNGQEIQLGDPLKLPPGNKRLQVLADSERFFVLVNLEDESYTHFNIDARPFRGQIIAYDRTGKQLWSQEIAQTSGRGLRGLLGRVTRGEVPMSLVVEDFDVNPLLLLVGEQSVNVEEIYHSQVRVLALDKATGETRLDWKRPAESGGFMDLQVNVADHSVELRTFESRLRLHPVAAAPAGHGNQP